MYKLTNEERETHITWNAASRRATIDTADPVVIRKLDKLAQEHPEAYRVTRTDEAYGAKWYEVDKHYIRFGKPASKARRDANRRNAEKSILRRESLPTGAF